MKKLNQNGSHIIALALGVVVLGVLVFAAQRVISNNSHTSGTTQTSEAGKEASSEVVRWTFNEQSGSWAASSTPPACKSPFKFEFTPVDISQATSVLYPGQTRGGNYKAHGGFGFDNNTTTKVDVKMPMDAYLVSASRYIETGQIQYILHFDSECGISFRFDHLLTLTPAVQTIIDKNLPEAKVDDSRGTNLPTPVLFKAGDGLATAIGFDAPKLNVGMDFGVYDYRQPNEASKSTAFQTAHGQFSAQTYYGVCWFDMLPGADAATAKALPSRDSSMGKTSDYCK